MGEPVGGRSLLEASLEARIKITDTIGIVPFVDAGTAFEASHPDFDGPSASQQAWACATIPELARYAWTSRLLSAAKAETTAVSPSTSASDRRSNDEIAPPPHYLCRHCRFGARNSLDRRRFAEPSPERPECSGEPNIALLSTPTTRVSIGSIEGALSSNPVIRDVSISDRNGVWLSLDHASGLDPDGAAARAS